MLSEERGTKETGRFGGFVQFDLEAEFLMSMDSPKEKPEVRAQRWDMGLRQGDYSIRRHDSALTGTGKLLLKEDNLKHNAVLTKCNMNLVISVQK